VDIKFSSTFSFLNDLKNVVFMAQQLNHTTDATKYQTIFTTVAALFHTQWFNTTTNLYADGGQTAQVRVRGCGEGVRWV